MAASVRYNRAALIVPLVIMVTGILLLLFHPDNRLKIMGGILIVGGTTALSYLSALLLAMGWSRRHIPNRHSKVLIIW